jgi:hypothetical protein
MWYLNRPASVPASAANPRLVMTLISAAGDATGIASPFGCITVARATPPEIVAAVTTAQIPNANRLTKLI